MDHPTDNHRCHGCGSPCLITPVLSKRSHSLSKSCVISSSVPGLTRTPGQNTTTLILPMKNSTQTPLPSPTSCCSSSSSEREFFHNGKTMTPSLASDGRRLATPRRKSTIPGPSPTTPHHEIEDIWRLIGNPVRGRPVRRRCVSCAEASHRARTWFSCPDRFLSPRAKSVERESIFRVSKSPHSLSPHERNIRQRDHNDDPFHSTSPSRLNDAVRARHSSPGGRQRPPHFTPSFVHGHDASPGPVDTTEPPNTPRQISVGAVWNVGGPTVAEGGPRLGVHDGHGGLLASGTNSPMHTAHFLNRNRSSQDARQHEDRLALALDIDQASRVLASIPVPLPMRSNSIESPERRPFTWLNNSWAREEGADRELSFESISC
jgi:hypothetical protein